jgi:glycosyltransferase involved in cell wall biosynthesis
MPAGKKILIYYYMFGETLGGSDYLPLLFIEELQRRGNSVTLALDWKSDIEHAAKHYDVKIDLQAVNVVLVKPENSVLRRLDAVLPFYRTRQLKKLAKHADVCISCANMFDFGKPAHHVVFLMRLFGDNAFCDFFMHRKPLSGLSLFKRKLRTFLAETVLRPLLGMRSTRTILADHREHIYVPSRYVANTMRAFYGDFNCTVFYPPTTFEIPPMAIERAPLRVVYLGRVQKEKGISEIIGIVERARAVSGQDIQLHIAGPLAPGEYADTIRRTVSEKPWIRLLGPVYGNDKAAFLLGGTYAVHARRDEEFGISIAEYLKAGIIPIVPDEGGSKEVVDAPSLTYRTDEDAARILARLLIDGSFRKEQADHCKERAKEFSFGQYMKHQNRILDRIMERPV